MIANLRPIQTANPASSVLVAEDVYQEFYAAPRALVRWQGTWWEWTGAIWREMSEEALDGELQRVLRSATYLDRNQAIVPWDPTDTKIAKVRNGLKAVASVPDESEPGRWFDGRRTKAIPCAGGYIGWDLEHVDSNDGLAGWRLYPPDTELFATSGLTVPLESYDDPEEWLDFLRTSFTDDDTGVVDQQGIDALQEWFGYLVSGRTDLQVMLQLLGPRRSGKGTIGRVIAALYGRSYGSISMDTLGYRFGLQGVLANPVLVLSDVRDVRPPAMAIERLLSITGEDPVRVEIKHGEGITTRIPSRIMIMANGVLQLPDAAGALNARSIFIRTLHSSEGHEDRTLDARLTTPDELRKILRWSFLGLERLGLQKDRFTQQEVGNDDRRMTRTLGNPIIEFLTDRYQRFDGARQVELDMFHQDYLSWRGHGMVGWKQTKAATRVELANAGFKCSRPKNAGGKNLSEVVHDITALVG